MIKYVFSKTPKALVASTIPDSPLTWEMADVERRARAESRSTRFWTNFSLPA